MSRMDRAVEVETAKYARVAANIERACEGGRITEHDRDERIARAWQRMENRVAWITGQPRPAQREQQPLDDPNAGRVG